MLTQLYKISLPQTILLGTGIALYWLLPLNDPDYFWHLKTGELIFSTGEIPKTDPFSFTMYGETWVLHEWLFQLLLYLSSQLLGEHGVRAILIGCIVITLYFTDKARLDVQLNKWLSKSILIALALSLIPFITPRPQLASYLFFAYYLYVIQLTITTRCARHCLPLPFIMVLWVNMHGGYLIGIALLTLVTATTWLVDRSSNKSIKSEQLARKLAYITLASLLASAINPDFVSHWKYPFYVLSMETTTWIDEWQSPNFRAPFALAFLIFVATYIFMLAFNRVKPSLYRLFIPPFFICAALLSARNIPFALFAIMAFLPRVKEIDTRRLHYLVSAWYAIKRRYTSLISNSREVGQMGYAMNWLILALVATIVSQLNLNPGTINDTYPHKAVDYFIEQGLQGNILSEYKNGGYLIYRLYPESHVFIDGRADMYGDKVVLEHAAIMNGSKKWRALFNKYNIDYIICNNRAPIYQQLLDSAGVELLYSDSDYSVIKKLRHITAKEQL